VRLDLVEGVGAIARATDDIDLTARPEHAREHEPRKRRVVDDQYARSRHGALR
jgi:hypothetical protein